jgi:hypothetical protein
MADNLDDILEVGRWARRPVFPAGHPSGSAGDDFPALRIIAGIHKVIAVIAFMVGVVGALVLLVFPGASALAVLIVVACTLLVPLVLWGSGELILLFLRIEQNTRRGP